MLSSNLKTSNADPENVFDIILPLGEGAYGAVYKAMDKRDGELVALKIMPLEAESGSLEKEVAIMKKCRSPYIVNFVGSFIKEGNIWLAMEYCGAGAVKDLMDVTGENMTENLIAIIMRETLKGLEYLHSVGLIHRDVKAGNILINDKGQCKLADFGVSRETDNGKPVETTIGTPYWMAPEVFKKGSYDNKADIWSLGITCIEMALGRPPHSDKPPLQVIFLIPKADPPNIGDEYDEFTDDFRDFISKCCIKDPTKRPNATQLLNHKFVKNAKSLNLMREWVIKCIPLLDKYRSAIKDADQDEQYDDDDDEDDDEDENGSDYGDYDNYGTMVTAVDKDDDEDEDEDEPDAYGTMLITSDDEKAGQAENDLDNDNDDAFEYGTMVFNESDTTTDNTSTSTTTTNNNNNNNNPTTAAPSTELNQINYTNNKPNNNNNNYNNSQQKPITSTNTTTNTDTHNKRASMGKGRLAGKSPPQKVYNKALPNYAYPKKNVNNNNNNNSNNNANKGVANGVNNNNNDHSHGREPTGMAPVGNDIYDNNKDADHRYNYNYNIQQNNGNTPKQLQHRMSSGISSVGSVGSGGSSRDLILSNKISGGPPNKPLPVSNKTRSSKIAPNKPLPLGKSNSVNSNNNNNNNGNNSGLNNNLLTKENGVYKIESVFVNNGLDKVNVNTSIINTKSDAISVLQNLKRQKEIDKQKLEEFYSKQIRMLQREIQKL